MDLGQQAQVVLSTGGEAARDLGADPEPGRYKAEAVVLARRQRAFSVVANADKRRAKEAEFVLA
eukprot:11174012-Lingulodinium_polyedra.AAC.1